MSVPRAKKKIRPYSRSERMKNIIKAAMNRNFIYTQKELSGLTGISKSVLSDKLNGKKRVTLDDFWLLNAVLSFTDEEWLRIRDC